MKNNRLTAKRFLSTLTMLMVLAAPLSFRNVSAGSEMGKDVNLSAQENLLGAPTNQVIVKYRSNANLKAGLAPEGDERLQVLGSAAGIDLQYYRPLSNSAHVLQLPEKLPIEIVERIASRLMALPDVEYAEPDYLMFPAFVPNDPHFGNQWHYFETYGVNLPAAWDITVGSDSLRIAVLDTGITDHVDLMGRWTGGYDFITDVLTANDGNGRDNDPHDPGNWVTFQESQSGPFTGCSVTNSTWHGTHVAGTIGAGSNNNDGVVGVNWVSQIVPIRVLGKCGGFTSDVADGIRWAAGLAVSGVPANTQAARVLNLSLAGIGACSATYQSAIDAVNAIGAIVVVSAGNNSANLNTTTIQPANCNGVITVAATDRGGDKTLTSNYGTTIEISAPGGETIPTLQNGVFSTLNTGLTTPGTGTYGYYSGTSMAAPHVSGIISLMLSLDPNLDSVHILQLLQNSASAFPPGSSCTTATCGSGIVNAGSALDALGIPPPTSTATQPPSFTPTAATATPSQTPSNTPPFTSTPSRTPSNTATFTASATASSTATFTFTPSRTATTVPSLTPSSTATFTPLPTASQTPSNTATSTFTSSRTSTAIPSMTPSSTATFTPVSAASQTPSNTATFTFTPSRTSTAIPSLTPSDTATFIPLATATQAPSSTATLTPSGTSTTVPSLTPSNTFTSTASPTASQTPSHTATITLTPSRTPTAIPSLTLSTTATFTASATAPQTPLNTATFTPSRTPTVPPSLIPSSTATFTPSAAPSQTPSNTATFTPLPTVSQTPSSTATFTPAQSPSNTATFTASATASQAPSNTATVSFTLTSTPSRTPSNTNTFTASATASQTPSQTPSVTFTPSQASTVTPLDTLTVTASLTPSPTSTVTVFSTPLWTPTRTPTASSTLSHTLTASVTPSQTPRSSPTATVPTQTKTTHPTKYPLPTNPVFSSRTLSPASLTIQYGSATGSLSSLGLIEQSGVDDDPSAYIRFETPGSRFVGYKSFYLPAKVRPANVHLSLFQVNFKGPAFLEQVWTWSIYDWKHQRWIKLGDNIGTSVGEWDHLIFRIPNLSRFISPSREIRIELRSSSSAGDAKIDYAALHITYRSGVPAPTRALPPSLPGRRPYIFPATDPPPDSITLTFP